MGDKTGQPIVKGGVIAQRGHKIWLSRLQSCNMAQFRKIIERGGEPVFVLDAESSFLRPIWLLLLKDHSGTLWRVTTSPNSLVRRLESIRQVYQIARTYGLSAVHVPVDNKR